MHMAVRSFAVEVTFIKGTFWDPELSLGFIPSWVVGRSPEAYPLAFWSIVFGSLIGRWCSHSWCRLYNPLGVPRMAPSRQGTFPWRSEDLAVARCWRRR